MTSQDFQLAPIQGSAMFWMFGGIMVLLLAALVFLGYLLYAVHNVSFAVTGEGLKISGGMYGRTIPKSALKVEEARVIDLTSGGGELTPKRRTNGVGMPGFQSGWFKLENGQKALLFLSQRHHAVYIPTTEGYALLVSPEQPDAFLEALRR
jgi:Bacterial PH domain